MNLSGVFPALTTPFSSDGSVSVEDIKHNIAKYNTTGLAGYVAIGSTGESVLLSRKEVDTVLVAVKESAAPGMRLIAGTGAESTAETIDRTKRAAELGYQAALVKTPYYYKPLYKPEIFIAHFRRVADASPIPVILYSVPQFTGVALEAPEVGVLAEHPNIIGIKESSGNVQRAAEMLAAVPPSFQILVGSASMMFPSMVLGAVGAILVRHSWREVRHGSGRLPGRAAASAAAPTLRRPKAGHPGTLCQIGGPRASTPFRRRLRLNLGRIQDRPS
jgi:4-hydroxy-2-oxoglutarate aldolase